MIKHTPAAHWREKGDPDPHGSYYDRERAELPLGNLTDDELANEVFMWGDNRPSVAEMTNGTAKMPIVYLTAGKERIRWLSRRLVEAEQQRDDLLAVLERASAALSDAAIKMKWSDIPAAQAMLRNVDEIDAAIAKAKGGAA